MLEKLKPHLLPIGLVALLVIVGYSYVQSRDDLTRMNVTLQQQQQLIVRYESTIKDLDKRMAERDEQVRQQLDNYRAVMQRVQTPQQIIREVPSYLPQLPKPIETQVTPEGKTQAVIPEEDLKPLFDMVVQAKSCAVELTATKAKVDDLQQKVGVLEQKVTAVEQQRDIAVKTAKGGGLWRRVGRGLKWAGIGIGIGLVLGHL